eukprot:g13061.t2
MNSKSFAAQVVQVGALAESTEVVLMPEAPEYGTPETWLAQTRTALEAIPDDDAGRKEMTPRLDALSTSNELSWTTVLGATLWNYAEYGVPTEAFTNARPHMCAIQGQHRLTAINAALSEALGLPLERCGDLGVGGLFPPSDNDGNPAYSKESMDKFRKTLQSLRLHGVVHDFLTHEQASRHGHLLRVAKEHTTTFGEKWRSKARKEFNRPFVVLRDLVKTELQRCEITVSMQILLTFVYAAALCPERPIVSFLLEHLEEQDARLKEFNAAKAMAARKGEPAPEAPDIAAFKEHPLSDLISLNERSQQSAYIRDHIKAHGVSDSLKHACKLQTVAELVCDMMISLVIVDQAGDVPGLDPESPHKFEKYTDELNLIKDFFTPEDLSKVADVDGLLQEIYALAKPVTVCGLLERLGVPLSNVKKVRIGRKALAAGQSRVVAAYQAKKVKQNPRIWSNKLCLANPSNRSSTIPKGGEQMHLSTCGVVLDWNLRQWAEWLEFTLPPHHLEEAARDRRVAAFCSLLLLDHVLAGSGLVVQDRLDRFKRLIDVFTSEAAVLFKKSAKFELPGGVPLLDTTRLGYLAKLNDAGKSVQGSHERASPGEPASRVEHRFQLSIFAPPGKDSKEGGHAVRVGGWELDEGAAERVHALLASGRLKDGELLSCRIEELPDTRKTGGVSKAGGSSAGRRGAAGGASRPNPKKTVATQSATESDLASEGDDGDNYDGGHFDVRCGDDEQPQEAAAATPPTKRRPTKAATVTPAPKRARGADNAERASSVRSRSAVQGKRDNVSSRAALETGVAYTADVVTSFTMAPGSSLDPAEPRARDNRRNGSKQSMAATAATMVHGKHEEDIAVVSTNADIDEASNTKRGQARRTVNTPDAAAVPARVSFSWKIEPVGEGEGGGSFSEQSPSFSTPVSAGGAAPVGVACKQETADHEDEQRVQKY